MCFKSLSKELKLSYLMSRSKGFKTEDDIESDKIEQSLRDSIVEIVRKREDKVFKGEEQNFGNDFLGSLLTAHHDADKKNRISVDNIIDECKVFFLAGHETTSSLLSWTFLFLAIHTDWQEKARNEVFQVFGQENPKSESLAKLKIVSSLFPSKYAYNFIRNIKLTTRIRVSRFTSFFRSCSVPFLMCLGKHDHQRDPKAIQPCDKSCSKSEKQCKARKVRAPGSHGNKHSHSRTP